MRSLVALSCVFASILVLGSCDKSDAPAASDKPTPDPGSMVKVKKPKGPTGTPDPQTKLTATVDGKPVQMVSALAFPRDGGWSFEVSNVPNGCADFAGGMHMFQEGEVGFSFQVAKKLQPDGKFAWRLSQVSFGAMTAALSGDDAMVSDLTEGDKIGATVKKEISSMAMHGEAAQKLVVDGAVSAVKCPAEKSDQAVAASPPVQPGSFEVAGQKVNIVGASISTEHFGPVIELSSGEVKCGTVKMAQAELYLRYMKEKPDEVWQADLMGDWFAGQVASQVFKTGKLVAKVTPAADGTADVALSGATEINGYPVKLSGQVKAVVCKKE